MDENGPYHEMGPSFLERQLIEGVSEVTWNVAGRVAGNPPSLSVCSKSHPALLQNVHQLNLPQALT